VCDVVCAVGAAVNCVVIDMLISSWGSTVRANAHGAATTGVQVRKAAARTVHIDNACCSARTCTRRVQLADHIVWDPLLNVELSVPADTV
jgi:hypothetical protein